MERDEEIIKASKDIFKENGDEFGKVVQLYWMSAFISGAKWADEHPKNVWHKASEEPEIGSNIVAIDYDGQWWDIQPYDGDYNGYGGLTGWACCAIHYNIKQWAYIDDLIKD